MDIVATGMQALNEARKVFREEYGIKAELVRASRVSEILDIPLSTLHQLLREGRFPIRHQKFGRLTLFALDDLALWHMRQRGSGSGDSKACSDITDAGDAG